MLLNDAKLCNYRLAAFSNRRAGIVRSRIGVLPIDDISVVPAQAGTHTPCRLRCG